MAYLQEFNQRILNKNWNKFLELWEEYVQGDEVDLKEACQILELIQESEFVNAFGKIADTALLIWEKRENKSDGYNLLSLIVDLALENTERLREVAFFEAEKKYGKDPKFLNGIKLSGIKSKDHFQRSLGYLDLYMHLAPHHFVFHKGGWGVGEIMEVLPSQETVVIEFENVSDKKRILFTQAFKTLKPLRSTHFLAKRFGNPDQFEKEAKEDPAKAVKQLLFDLGPKNAAEIKDEFLNLVIPEEEFTKFWNVAKNKLKKDPFVYMPEKPKEAFYIRSKAVEEDEKISDIMSGKQHVQGAVIASYKLLKDTPSSRKEAVKEQIKEKLYPFLKDDSLNEIEKIQLNMVLYDLFKDQEAFSKASLAIESVKNMPELLEKIDILSLKKEIVQIALKKSSDWLLTALFNAGQAPFREYLLGEMHSHEYFNSLEKGLKDLLQNPSAFPEFFVWYFQKVIKDSTLPLASFEEQGRWLESLLILLSRIESNASYKELTRKIYVLLSDKRYELLRTLIQGRDLEFIKEFLLLSSKCHTFTSQDLKIFRSLAEVVHPSLMDKEDKQKEKDEAFKDILWTTEASYKKVQERIKEIATKEMIENAKEVEAARALGDLRENSEYKFAVEKRARLQGEMKTLSQEFSKARVITELDVNPNEVSIGSVVTIQGNLGSVLTYTILGTWDADVEKNILSYRSKLGELMMKKKIKDTFEFRDEIYEIISISSCFHKG